MKPANGHGKKGPADKLKKAAKRKGPQGEQEPTPVDAATRRKMAVRLALGHGSEDGKNKETKEEEKKARKGAEVPETKKDECTATKEDANKDGQSAKTKTCKTGGSKDEKKAKQAKAKEQQKGG